MIREIVIRHKKAADIGAIAEVVVAAFETLAMSNHAEQFIIAGLRAANAVSVSFLAELNGRVVEHVAFAPVTISDGSQNRQRAWACVGVAGIAASEDWQSLNTGRAITSKRLGCSRMLPRRRSGVLQAVRIQRYTRVYP